MITPVPQLDGLPEPAINANQPPAAIPSPQSASQSLLPPGPSEEEDGSQSQSYSFEGELSGLETPLVAPFQLSNAMPAVFAQTQPSEQHPAVSPLPAASPAKPSRRRLLSLPMIAVLVCAVVILGLLAMDALAQPTPSQMRGNGTSPRIQSTAPAHMRPQPTTRPSPSPVPTNGPATTDWVPQQLPPGWTNAGLQTGDGIQALRTAVAFNDREMSLDYRSIGTRTNHAGTFTAATFVMTPAAQLRFQHNDVREINDVLFDRVVATRLIRLVVDPQPRLVAFAQQGQQQFAWVDVAFQLWQSQIVPNTAQQRMEGKELDPATNQPRVHQMMVLLLRFPPQNAGANPAMGGTGWLVSNYGLDLPNGTTLGIVQPA